jgi:hypothetical protein
MLLQNYYNPELLGDATDSCSAVLNVRNLEFLSQPEINGYYCNSASREKMNRFFAVYSQHTMAVDSLTVPCFSKDCWLSAGGEQFDCSDSNLSFSAKSGLLRKSFLIFRAGKEVFRHDYWRDWKFELFHAHSSGSGYPDYEDFFSYIVSHAVAVRRKAMI